MKFLYLNIINLWELIFLFFSFQSIIVALILLLKRSNLKKANIFWGIFLMLFAYNIFYNVLYWSKFNEYLFYRLMYINLIPFSLYGALFYFYVKNLVAPKSLKLSDVLHLIPFLTILFIYGRFYLTSLEVRQSLRIEGKFKEYFWFPGWYVFLGLTLLLLFYAYISFKVFKKNYSADKEMNLWLKLITILFAGFGLSFLAYFVLLKIGVLEKDHDYIITFMMILLISCTTYFGFIHSSVFNGKSLVKTLPFLKYNKSGLSESHSIELQKELLEVMTTKEPYLDSDLKLIDLAGMMNINRHHASQIINENFDMSFFEFINNYRVEEAERLITNIKEENLKLVDVAYRSGFNNRITFYKAFKNKNGITPSEYKSKILSA